MSKQTLPISVYTSKDGNIELTVSLDNDTIWLQQEQIASIF
jgi:hypothetical protein